MAEITKESLFSAFDELYHYDQVQADNIRLSEDKVDKYEDKLGSYLVKLSAESMTRKDSAQSAELLRIIGDIERISDHSVNILESAEEMHDKDISFSDSAKKELNVLIGAVKEVTEMAMKAFNENDMKSAALVEPVEQVVDDLKKELKKRHVARLQRGECTIELGFVFQDIITNLERIADHCSNIAGCVMEIAKEELHIHELLKEVKADSESGFAEKYEEYKEKYALTD